MSYLEELVASVPMPGNIAAARSDPQEILANAAEKYGIPDKLPILQRMLQVESGGSPNAKSPKGARGYMQLMPETARALGVKNILDPEENIHGGVRYFKEQLDTFQDDALAIAAYNAGPGRVQKANGIPNIKETQNYVNKILAPISGKMGGSLNDPRGDRLHYGGDISAPAGTEFVAPTRLKITHVREQMSNSPGGMVWGTDPSTGLQFKFHHVQPGVKVGSIIEAGQPLGTLSSISGPHLDMKVFDPKKNEYVNFLDSNKIKRGDMFSAGQPMGVIGGGSDTSAMVADVSGQVTPSVPYQKSPEKQKTISDILGGLAKSMGPSEAAAAEPPKSVGWLEDLVKNAEPEPVNPITPANLPPSGKVGQAYYPPGFAPISDTGLKAKMPTAPQSEPPDFMTIGKAAMVDSPEAKFKIFAKARFPNNPNKWKDYFIDGAGNVMYSDKGIIKPEVPKEILEKAKEFSATEMIGRGFENTGAAAGYALGGPPGAAILAGIGSVGRQKFAQDFFGDKPKTVSEEAWTAVKESIMAGLGGMVGGGGLNTAENYILRKSAGSGLLGKLEQQFRGNITQAEINKWVPLYNRYGIDYTVAEVTNSPTLQGLVQMLTVVPGTAKEKAGIFQKFTRTPQIDRAIQRELTGIAPELSTLEAGQAAQEAAAGVKSKLIAERKSGVSQLYKTAEETAGPVDVQPVIEKIDSMISKVSPGGIERKQLEAMKGLFTLKPKTETEAAEYISNISQVKSARDNLNKIIKGKYDPALPAAENTLNRESSIIKNLLSGQMYEAAPEYKIADVEFARLSGPINEYLYGTANKPAAGKPNTLIQKIGKIENSEQLEKVPGQVFSATPQAIKNMREFFINNGYEGEWNILVRGMLQDRLGKVKTNVTNEERGMLGANFARKAFGDPEFQRKFQAAMTPDQFRSLTNFFDLMEQTGKIVYSNSQTTPMAKLIEAVKDTPIGPKDVPITLGEGYANIVEMITSPSKVIDRAKAKRLLEKQDALWEALLTPDMARRLAAVKKMPPGVDKAQRFILTFIGIGVKHETEGAKNVEPVNK